MEIPQMQLEDWLDDLCVRFIINLPEEDLSSVARICFQVEEAQWFYEDFIRPLDPSLPSMSLRTFCLRIFQHCPLLAHFSVENHTKAFEEFLEYKTRIPVRGAIMLNHEMDSAVLVKGWKKGANWGFPGGKINKDEDDLDCAVREVYEETGLDLHKAGLVPEDRKTKYIELPIKNHQVRLYVFRDVPMNTDFQPQTRKEISKIQWYHLSELPTFRRRGQGSEEPVVGANKFYMVAPFMVPLKKWVSSQKKHGDRRGQNQLRPTLPIEETATEDDAWLSAGPSQPPAIDTLDGATQELHRLLKLQPPNAGAQVAPPVEDKGSALLSLLRRPGVAAAQEPSHPPASHLPRTPHDISFIEGSQPYAPQARHGNEGGMFPMSQQPPPSFPLQQNLFAHGWAADANSAASQAYSQQPVHAARPSYDSGQTNMHQQHPPHPQFQQSGPHHTAFQGQHMGSPPMPGTHQAQLLSQLQRPQQPQQGLTPQHVQPSPGQTRSVLNGQSLALLNAFKRGSAPGMEGAPETVPILEPHQEHAAPVEMHQNMPSAAPNPQPSLQRLPSQTQGPTELGGTAVTQPTDFHGKALLDMFKKAGGAVSPLNQPPVASTRGTPNSQASRDLLMRLQSQSPATHGPSSEMPTQNRPVEASLERLVIQPRPEVVNSQAHMLNGKAAVRQGQASPAANRQAQPQPGPMRILQRGELLQSPEHSQNETAPPPKPSRKVSYHAVSPSTAGPAPMPAETQNPKPDGPPSDQRRQLLSLFGRQQASPSSMAPELVGSGGMGGPPMLPPVVTGAAPADHGRSRLSSLASNVPERRGSQTPISPADQSFLFQYLQSVTKTTR